MATSRPGLLLALVAGLFALDTGMYSTVAPILPTLRAEFGLDGLQAGVLVAAYPLGLVVSALPAGSLATRLGPRLSVSIGVAVACLGFGLAPSYLVLVVARLLQGVAASLTWAAGLAWLSAVASTRRQGVAVGSAISAALAGSVAGPLIGVAATSSRALVFAALAAMSLAAATLLALQPSVERKLPSQRRSVRALFGGPGLTMAWIVALCGVLVGTLAVRVPLRLDALGITTTGIGVTFTAAAVIEITLGPISGHLHDRWGARAPLSACLLIGGVALLVFALVSAPIPVLLASIVAMPFLGALLTPSLAGFAEHGTALRYTAEVTFGIGNFVWGIGEVVGAVLSGTAGVGSDVQPIDLVLAVLVLLSLPVVIRAGSRQHESPEAPAA
jgi:MFS transporter, DHA1 family, solute carrier family 18 (vesicular amine transporter), member 1/2